MDLQVSLKKILKKGIIAGELEFQRALVIDRRLRLLIKEFPELEQDRNHLRALLKNYEDNNWLNEAVTNKKIEESDFAEVFAEEERVFTEKRKHLIKLKLNQLGLTQKELGIILGHTSATYMSELINGVNPFTLNDLVVIHHLLNIGVDKLVPVVLPRQARERVLETIKQLNKPGLMRMGGDLAVV